MPIIRYFVFVGGLLLALLFASDRYLPAPVERAGAADPDRTPIRISSARSLPEKIVFDTRPRTDVPVMVQAEPPPEEPQRAVQEALGAMPAAPPTESKKEPRVRTSAEARPHVKRLAKSSRRPPKRRLAFDRQELFSGGW